jgi:acid stress-induced BolA-like protein IbaG/YrbA
MQEEISRRILERFADARVDVTVEGNRALITVVSEAFEPMSRVQKQQAVYGCIDELIKNGSLHAVTIRALTSAE